MRDNAEAFWNRYRVAAISHQAAHTNGMAFMLRNLMFTNSS